MSRLDDIFGGNEPEEQDDDFGIEVDANVQCGICFRPADEAFYNKQKKKIKIICYADPDDRHTVIGDLDLSFIYG